MFANNAGCNMLSLFAKHVGRIHNMIEMPNLFEHEHEHEKLRKEHVYCDTQIK